MTSSRLGCPDHLKKDFDGVVNQRKKEEEEKRQMEEKKERD